MKELSKRGMELRELEHAIKEKVREINQWLDIGKVVYWDKGQGRKRVWRARFFQGGIRVLPVKGRSWFAASLDDKFIAMNKDEMGPVRTGGHYEIILQGRAVRVHVIDAETGERHNKMRPFESVDAAKDYCQAVYVEIYATAIKWSEEEGVLRSQDVMRPATVK